MPKQPPQARSGSNLGAIAFIALLALGVYAQTVAYDFVNFDDPQYVYENEFVKSGLNARSVAWALTNISHMCWQPLTWMSHMLDCQLFGLNPAWAHAHNVMLHCANSILLFVLFRSMSGAPGRSFFLAALFTVHPLGAESVAWIAERKNLLAALFMLLTLCAYHSYALHKSKRSYALALLFFTAGLLSKPSIVTLPCLMLLLDIWPLNRYPSAGPPFAGVAPLSFLRSAGRLVLEKLPFFALTALYLWLFVFMLGHMYTAAAYTTVPMSLRLANAVVSYIKYAGLIVWPQQLAVYYPFPQSIPVWQVVVAAGLILAVCGVSLMNFKRRPYLFVGWFWFLGTLVPAIGIVQAGLWPALADRWVYTPMIGILIMVAWEGGRLVEMSRCNQPTAVAAMVVIIGTYACAAHLQTRFWRDSISLFHRAVEVTQRNFVAHDNLGNALAMQGRFDEALKHFRAALEIKPAFWKAHQNAGAVYLIKDDLERAIQHLEKALVGRPNAVRIHNNLGRAYSRRGRNREAMESYRRALHLDPGNKKAIENLKRLTREKPVADNNSNTLELNRH